MATAATTNPLPAAKAPIHHARADHDGEKIKYMAASGAWVMVKRRGADAPHVLKLSEWKAMPSYFGDGGEA